MTPQKPVVHLKRVPGKQYDTKDGHTWTFGKAIRWDSQGASHWMRGPCPNCGSPTSNYGGGWSCHYDYCPCSANIFACNAGPTPIWWETEIDVFKDGNQWCATMGGFISLQESPAGFGGSPNEAVKNLADNLNCIFEKAPLQDEVKPVQAPSSKYTRFDRLRANNQLLEVVDELFCENPTLIELRRQARELHANVLQAIKGAGHPSQVG